jgi:hypothetical protein
MRSIGPKFLFWGTLCAVLAIGVLSFFYLRALNQLEADNQAIAQVRADYEKRVQDLQKRLIVTQTKTVKVANPTVTQTCSEIKIPLGPPIRMCTPQVKNVEQEVVQVEKVEDPNIRAELDQTQARLKDLSARNQAANSVVEQLKPWNEFAQEMMKPIISIIVLIVSLIIILSKRYNAEQEKWAFGSLGTIIGAWLK